MPRGVIYSIKSTWDSPELPLHTCIQHPRPKVYVNPPSLHYQQIKHNQKSSAVAGVLRQGFKNKYPDSRETSALYIVQYIHERVPITLYDF